MRFFLRLIINIRRQKPARWQGVSSRGGHWRRRAFDSRLDLGARAAIMARALGPDGDVSLKVFLFIAALAAPATASAQSNEVLDAPELRNFSLPGTRTTPPAPEPDEAPQTEPVAITPPPRPSLTPARPPIGQTPPPEATVRSREAPEPVEVPERPGAEIPDEPITPAPPPQSTSEAESQEKEAVKESRSWSEWLPWAGGAAIILIAGLLFLRSRRRAAEIEEAVRLANEGESGPAPRPVMPPLPPPPPSPRIEIEFRPERLVSTDAQAAVHFEVTLRNTGNAAAQNMRIEARMFNASGAEAREVDSFFRSPPQPVQGPSALALPPLKGMQFTSAVTMPRQQIRVLEMGGRPLFVPTVALKIVYETPDGEEQRIVRRYLVGIEPKEPSGKMGPFRLDVGPRIYRQVG